MIQNIIGLNKHNPNYNDKKFIERLYKTLIYGKPKNYEELVNYLIPETSKQLFNNTVSLLFIL